MRIPILVCRRTFLNSPAGFLASREKFPVIPQPFLANGHGFLACRRPFLASGRSFFGNIQELLPLALVPNGIGQRNPPSFLHFLDRKPAFQVINDREQGRKFRPLTKTKGFLASLSRPLSRNFFQMAIFLIYCH
jgi:hypothetical protein